ncbi:hypothetical protein ORN01_25325 [Bacillus cereus]|uniref:ArdC-like ssDNA-binding domain-containing protein n=1 Tax=Bacillus cereus group TaxID=86661 RepID=UPI0022E42ECE|nr:MULTISPECIES: ArdC-like ssDNA-binding domain-containing protein [Bacillus cereus group]MDA1509602.1 hypothetical protein [Bacillus cereus group sp. TH36-2LC]MDZ4632281.1 hypothetical protein [Bacillus cereus]
MTNFEIVELEAGMIGYEFDGNNLKTFAEWKKEGFSVKKGEKAIIKCGLWKPFKKKVTDQEGNKVIDEKTGKQKEETRFKLVNSSLFTREQVEKIKEKKEVVPVEVVEEKETVIIEEAVTPFVKIEAVVQPDSIEVVEEKEEIEIKKSYFVRKASNVNEVQKGEFADYDRYAISEEIKMDIVEFNEFSQNLLSDRKCLEGKGGTYTTTEPEGCEDVENFFELTPAQQDQWRKGAYRKCIKVTCEASTFSLIVDPQGYNYARYTAIEWK